jgi:hypothetical protein
MHCIKPSQQLHDAIRFARTKAIPESFEFKKPAVEMDVGHIKPHTGYRNSGLGDPKGQITVKSLWKFEWRYFTKFRCLVGWKIISAICAHTWLPRREASWSPKFRN